MWTASEECLTILPGQDGRQVPHPTIPGIDIFGMEFDLVDLSDEDAVLRAIDAFSGAASNAFGISLDQLPQV
jgi:hypothetical protein